EARKLPHTLHTTRHTLDQYDKAGNAYPSALLAHVDRTWRAARVRAAPLSAVACARARARCAPRSTADLFRACRAQEHRALSAGAHGRRARAHSPGAFSKRRDRHLRNGDRVVELRRKD